MVLLQVSLTIGQPLVRLTFGQMYPVEVSVIMSATTSGQLDYWSAFESG